MATSAYHNWDAAGRPWKPARPVDALAKTLRAHGYVVYVLGNQAHQTAAFPEDHTVFSASSWPGKHPYPYVLALDIMPPRRGAKSKVDGKPLPSLQALGARLYADKQAGVRGVAWLKYMNWEPHDDYSGPCWHDSWQPTHRRRASTDRGHIHLSCRTDFHTSTVADGYDPVARIRKPSTPTPPEDDDMPLTDKDAPVIRRALHSTEIGRTGVTFAAALDSLRAAAVQSRLRDEAILSAVAGLDTASVLARVNALAEEMAEEARADAERDAALLALVQQGQDGTLDAADVVRRIGDLLTAGAASDDA